MRKKAKRARRIAPIPKAPERRTLAVVVAEFETGFSKVKMAPPHAVAPNGELHISLTSSGVKQEVHEFPAYFTSEELAAEAWLREARELAACRSTLYWRQKPFLIRCRPQTKEEKASDYGLIAFPDDPKGPLFQVYARLQFA